MPADRAKPAAGSVLVTKVMSGAKRNGEGKRSRQGQKAVGSDHDGGQNLSDDPDGGESSTTNEDPSVGENNRKEREQEGQETTLTLTRLMTPRG